MNKDAVSEMLVVGGLAVFLLLAAQEQWPSGFYVILRLSMCSAAAYLGWNRLKEKKVGWAFFYLPLLVLFNPLDKPHIAAKQWRVIDLLLALIFSTIAAEAMWRSNQSSLQVTAADPLTIAIDPPLPATVESPSAREIRQSTASDAIEHEESHTEPSPSVEENQYRDASAPAPIDPEIADDLTSAQRGDVYAQFRLGLYFLEQDDPKSANWLLQAAYSGNTEAEYLVGCLYANERFLPLDLNRAAMWIERAAKAGYVDAQCRLAWVYHAGHGVPKDDTIASFWFSRAAEKGAPGAEQNLRILENLSRGDKKQPTDDEKRLMIQLGFETVEDLELWMNIPVDLVVELRCRAEYPNDNEEEDEGDEA